MPEPPAQIIQQLPVDRQQAKKKQEEWAAQLKKKMQQVRDVSKQSEKYL